MIFDSTVFLYKSKEMLLLHATSFHGFHCNGQHWQGLWRSYLVCTAQAGCKNLSDSIERVVGKKKILFYMNGMSNGWIYPSITGQGNTMGVIVARAVSSTLMPLSVFCNHDPPVCLKSRLAFTVIQCIGSDSVLWVWIAKVTLSFETQSWWMILNVVRNLWYLKNEWNKQLYTF